MAQVEISINGTPIQVEAGSTVLTAAGHAGIYIPALCYHPDLPTTELTADEVIYQNTVPVKNEGGTHPEPCGLCLVQIEGLDTPVRACATPVASGMVISTDSPEINARRKDILIQILSHHPNICLTCDRVPRCPPFGVCVRSASVPDRCVACPGYGSCELLKAADHVGMLGLTIPHTLHKVEAESEIPFFDFDPALCIGCTRCVRLCRDVRKAGALGFVFSAGRVNVGTKAPTYLDSGCRFCMGCVEICPTGALTDKRLKWQEPKDAQARRDLLVPCRSACPLGIDVPRYVYLIAKRRLSEALAVIEERLPFPLLCGTVCTHPCEAACRRAVLDEPIAIRDLKRFAAEHAPSVPLPVSMRPPSEKRVAVIGSGPAGLAAAYLLASRGGHAVTVFEAMPVAGGMLAACIPRFRLPQSVLDMEIQKVVSAGVRIQTGNAVTALEALFEEGYDAVCVATGAHREIHLGIEGENAPSVLGALELLKGVNLSRPFRLGNAVAVIGGGNVALDTARTALRCGAGKVTIVYRRSRQEMPADPSEIERAEMEGVQFLFLSAPTRITAEDGHTRLHLIQTRLRGKDQSGRARAFPVRGSDFHMDVDTVIPAVGQEPEIPLDFGLETETGNRLRVAPEQPLTSRPGVFAAGDAVSGPWNVAGAVATGMRAADAIDRFLGGKGFAPGRGDVNGRISPVLDQSESFPSGRFPAATLPLDKSLAGFHQVELGLNEENAFKEANRCLRCSLRLDLCQPGFAGNPRTKEEQP